MFAVTGVVGAVDACPCGKATWPATRRSSWRVDWQPAGGAGCRRPAPTILTTPSKQRGSELITRALRWREGAWESPRGRLAFKVAQRADIKAEDDGGRQRPPLLVLHGGPGVPHDYLLPLASLADDACPRAVVFYDQLGCGLSDAPQEVELYSVEASVAELGWVLGRVREELGLRLDDQIHLLGQSWGGILAYAALVTGGLGKRDLASLCISNSPAEVGLVEAEAEALLAACESVEAFMATHNCRANPAPSNIADAYAKGGTVFRGSGAITGWKVRTSAETEATWPEGLHTLLVTGEHDFITRRCVEPWLEVLPRSRWEIIKDGSHMPFNEPDGVAERYLNVVASFLAEHDDI